MKPQKNSKKTLIVAIIAVVVLAIIYFYFSGGTVSPDAAGSLQSQSATVAGTRVFSLLNQIKSLHIDTKIFERPEYKTLVDYSVAIPELPVGRPNPFAPIPGVSASTVPNAAR